MMDMPIVRITVDGMKQEILHAFMGRQDDIAAAAKKALDEALAEPIIERECKKQVDECLRHIIRETVANRITTDFEFRDKLFQLCREPILKAMEEKLKED